MSSIALTAVIALVVVFVAAVATLFEVRVSERKAV
jgi:hypothetical protein